MKFFYECNLCGIILADYSSALARHERFHLHCKKEHRNTTEGIVGWRKV